MDSWKAIVCKLFNIKEALYHRTRPSEIELIKATNLFNFLDQKQTNNLLHSFRLVKYQKGECIIREGDEDSSIYIVVEGTVHIFTLDLHHVKVSLNTLDKGDYFGEQAPLGSDRTRNASVESLSDVTLIQIPGKFLRDVSQKDLLLKEAFNDIGYKQAIHSLTSVTGFFWPADSIIFNIKHPKIIEYKTNELIFEEGDLPDDVYIILHGTVLFQRANHSSSENPPSLYIHTGHLFGELNFQNAPTFFNKILRAATAMAYTDVRVLSIKRNEFKEMVNQDPQLQVILEKLKITYQLPWRDIVEQYFGSVFAKNPIITTIYKLKDGRDVISSMFIRKDYFNMFVVNAIGDKRVQYIKGNQSLDITLKNNIVISFIIDGSQDMLLVLCRMLLDQVYLSDLELETIKLTGKLGKV